MSKNFGERNFVRVRKVKQTICCVLIRFLAINFRSEDSVCPPHRCRLTRAMVGKCGPAPDASTPGRCRIVSDVFTRAAMDKRFRLCNVKSAANSTMCFNQATAVSNTLRSKPHLVPIEAVKFQREAKFSISMRNLRGVAEMMPLHPTVRLIA